ncbi:MAG: Uma2 family endonuclease [Actinomycetota bacterium]
MGAVTALPQSRPLTRADLEGLPDDGHRYELVDGSLLVTPAPSWLHQRVVTRLAHLLSSAVMPPFEVFVAPLDVVLADDTVLQPDVLVVRRADLGTHDVEAAPVLAVEVLSPSTRRIDETVKRARYEAAGCPAFWAVDPDPPSLTAWTLEGGRYGEPVVVQAQDTWTATAPFTVTVRPAELVADG